MYCVWKVCKMYTTIDIDRKRRRYINSLHNNNVNSADGYITLATKQDVYKQYHYKLNSVLYEIDYNQHDMYMSMNNFYIPRRGIDTIKRLNALYVDIDYYKTKYNNITEVMEIVQMRSMVFDNIPVPSYVVNSGRGMYLVWLIEQESNFALATWQSVQQYLCQQLLDVGADANAIDAARILRVPGTVNSKSNTEVKIIVDNHNLSVGEVQRYNLFQLQKQYLPDLTKEVSKSIQALTCTLSLAGGNTPTPPSRVP